MLKEAAEVYIGKHTNYTAFHVLSLYRFGEQLMKQLYNLFQEFNDSIKPSFLGFVNGKLPEISDAGSQIRKIYLNTMWLFDHGPRNKKN